MKKIKILHFITGLSVGGAEMMLLKTLPRMSNQFENIVCSISSGEIADKLRKEKIKVYSFNLKKWQIFKIIKAFCLLLRKEKPDILVTYLLHADIFGRIFGSWCGVKRIICSKRGSTVELIFIPFMILDRLTSFLVKEYICVSHNVANQLINFWKINSKKVVAVPNGIIMKQFDFKIDPIEKKLALGLNKNDLVITFTANLRPGKGHDYLVKSFAAIAHKYPRVKLLLIGSDQGKENEIKQIVKSLKIESKVLFLGYRNDVLEILKATDIFVFPSLHEGMSNALLEAMASGCAVVASDIGPNLELVDNKKNGLTFKVGNDIDLTEKLDFLINKPNNIKRFGLKAAEKIINNFDINKTIRKLEHIYNSVLNS